MESHSRSTPAEELEAIEQLGARASIAPMPVPSWIWPTLAVCASGFALGFALGGVFGPLLATAFALAAAALSLRITRNNGVVPDPRNQPRELTMMQGVLVVKVAVLAVAMVLLGIYVNRWLPVALAGPIFALLAFRHDQRYEARTAELRAATA